MPIVKNETPAIGIIGGSGLYQIEELRDATEHKIDTPFGAPSDTLVGGKITGRQVYFLPRHGRGHRILPHEINYRANIYALRSLNVRWIGGGSRQLAGKIRAAGRGLAFAVL
jgi:5'-methylthioadenosine phosphorylase